MTGKEFLTLKESADLLGVSLSTLHRMRAAEAMPPAIKLLENTVRYSREELSDWMKSGAPDAKVWAAMKSKQKK